MKEFFKNKRNIIIALIAVWVVIAIVAITLVVNISSSAKPKWNTGLLEENLPVPEETYKQGYAVSSSQSVTFYADEIYDQSYANYGIIVVKNETNHIGFYSLHYNKFIIERTFYAPWLQYSITPNANLGFFINIRYDDVVYLYDSLSNLIYCDEYAVTDIYTTVYESNTYLAIKLSDDTARGYVYSDNGQTYVYSNTETIYEFKENTNQDNNKSPFFQGSQYVDIKKLDLTEYGRRGYYISTSNNLYTLFNSNNEVVSTYYVPSNALSTVFVKDSIIYQTINQLPSDVNNYDFSEGDKKYQLKTFKVNIFNDAKIEQLNTNFIIESANAYKDVNGNYNLLLASIKMIDEDRISSQGKVVILDSNCVLCEELSGYEPKSFIKLGSSYYNKVTKILYDYSLVEIAYLGAINPIINEEYNVIIGNINGLYGVINYSGIVVVPFEFDSFVGDIYKNVVIGIKDYEYYFVNVYSGNTQKAKGKLTKYANGLYLDYSKDSIRLLDYTQYDYLDVYYEISYNYYQALLNNTLNKCLFNDAQYYFVSTCSRFYEDSELKYTFYKFVLNSFKKESISTVGSQNNISELDGTTYEKAPELQLTSVPLGVHQTGSQYNYYKFTPDKTSTYTLNVAGKDSVYVYKVVHEKEVYSDTEYKYIKTYEDVLKFNHQNPELAASWLEECNYTYDLTGGETYYFIMRNNTDAYFTYTLSEEVGLNEEAPALIIIDNKTTTLNTNYRETTKYYRLYCDFALTFDITSNYSINFYTYSAFTNNEQSITEISLSKGVKTYVVTDNTSIYSGSVNLVAQLDNYTYGSSILESVNLSDGDAVEFVYDSTSQLTNNRYFKYANNTDTSKTFVLYAGNYEIVRYSVKGFKQTEDNYLTKNYTTIILQPYETLYGICELSSTKTTSIAILSDVYNERTTLGNVAQIKEYETGNYSIEITNYYTDGTQLTSYVMDSSYSKINPVIYNVYKLYNNKTYYIVTILPINLKTNILNSGIKTSVIRKYSVSITSNIDNSGTYGIDKDVTVTFNSNGGSDIAPQTITKDTALIYPQIPTRSNYVFTGWYTDQSCQNVFDFTSPVYENITLFAGWEYVSTSSYYSRTIIDSTQYNSSTNRYYTSVSSSSSFSNAYYVYTSFLTSGRKTIYYKNDQTSYSYATYLSIYNETQGTTIKSDDYFYSTSYYSVSFNVNAGDIIKIKFYDRSYSTSLYMYFDGATTPLGGNLGIKQMYAIKNTTFDIFAVPKLGYKFVGWYIGENLLSEYETYAYYGLNSDIQIEAKWEKLSQHNLTINSDYTQIALFEINSANLSSSVVTFDSNGGSDISSQTVTPTTKLEYPTVPTRNHYVFTGWYTEKSCENLFNFTDPVFEDMTLYAGWEYASASAYYSKIIIDSAQYNSSSDYYYTNISNSSYSGNAYYVYTTFLTSGTKTIYFKNNQSSYNYATYLSIYNQTKATTIRSESYFYTSNYDSVSFEVDAGDIIRIKFYDYNYSTCLYMYFENAVYPTNTDYTISSKIYAECYVTVEYELLYEDNFEFLGWYDGDILLSTDLKYIILMPNKDYTITAKWEYIY